MADEPLVSIITIFLNAGRYIEEAIVSVFAQEYPRWELLLVDDGSSDEGTAIARRYAETHPDRVRYLEHPGHVNRGMSASRNLGIASSRGSLIALLDADDAWLPVKLARQVAILGDHPDAGMVFGRTLYWYGWTGRPEDIGRDFSPRYAVESGTLVEPPTLLLRSYPLGHGKAPCPSDFMFRAEVIERTGSFEDSYIGPLQMYEDQAFLAKIYLKEKVYVSGELWDRYRQHPESCVSTVQQAGKYDAVRLHFLDWLEGYLGREQVSDERIWRACRRARWLRGRPLANRITRRLDQIWRVPRMWVDRLSGRKRGVTRPKARPDPA